MVISNINNMAIIGPRGGGGAYGRICLAVTTERRQLRGTSRFRGVSAQTISIRLVSLFILSFLIFLLSFAYVMGFRPSSLSVIGMVRTGLAAT